MDGRKAYNKRDLIQGKFTFSSQAKKMPPIWFREREQIQWIAILPTLKYSIIQGEESVCLYFFYLTKTNLTQ